MSEKKSVSGTVATYRKLIPFIKPYRFKLALGIICGLIVGGSLFGSLMLLPNMLMVVKQDNTTEKTISVTAEKIVADMEKNQNLSEQEKLEAVEEILNPADADPQLTSSMNKLRHYAEKFNLPMVVGKKSVTFTWPGEFEFPIVDNVGKMTWQFFSVYVVLFMLAWLIKNLATFLNHYYTRWVGARVITDMRNSIYSNLVNQSMGYFGRQDVGQLLSRCTNDTAAIESSVSNTIADATRCPLEIIACVSAIICFSIQQDNFLMTFLLFVVMPLCILPVIILARKIRKIYKKAFANIAIVYSRMHETFTGILIVKANHMEKAEEKRFSDINNKYFKSIVKALRYQLLMHPLMEIVAVAASLGFLVFSYGKGINITEMLAVLAPAILAYRPIKDLAKVVSHLQRSMAAADRYFEIMETDTALKEAENPTELAEFKTGIQFRDVKFAYSEGHDILNGVSFDIPKGSMVAVVGETGSGKTTIANLIARFYDVTGGSVSIDGVDVRQYSIASIRRNIGIVTQDPILFNETIADNIAYGTKDATREQIIEAAKQANAHKFITGGGHPGGYDEEVGEKGFRLSGGEKQRVSIARAILKNPPILILDEATSALDTVTEKLVQEALNNVMTNRTVFAIAHRLSTIRNANRIIVLEKGKIVETGTHDELLALGGRYKRLHDTQFSMD